jgi:hypothetical protein
MTSINPNDIYLKVTDTYRAVALDSSACCGTNNSCCGSDLYDIDLSGAPISEEEELEAEAEAAKAATTEGEGEKVAATAGSDDAEAAS